MSPTIPPPAPTQRELDEAAAMNAALDRRMASVNAVSALREAQADSARAQETCVRLTAKLARMVHASKLVERELVADPAADAVQHEWARILRVARDGAE